MYFIGGDIHKDVSTFNVMNSRLKTVDEFVDVPTSDEGFRCITWNYNPNECYILIESSTRSNYVARAFRNSGYNIIVGHARDLKNINCAKTKTDRIDARKLAEYAAMYHDWEKFRPVDDYGRPVRPPFRASRVFDIVDYEKRTLARQNMAVSRFAAGYKKTIQEYMSAQDISMPVGFKSVDSKRSIKYLREMPDDAISFMLDVIESTQEWSSGVESKLRNLLEDDEGTKLLMTIPGIDFKTAAYFSMAIGDVTDFETSDKLAAYFGLVPRIHESNHKRASGQSIVRDSSNKLRRAVYDAVRCHIRCCRKSQLSKFHLRMMYKIGQRSAEAATGRKLVTVMWAMLTYREPFALNHSR